MPIINVSNLQSTVYNQAASFLASQLEDFQQAVEHDAEVDELYSAGDLIVLDTATQGKFTATA